MTRKLFWLASLLGVAGTSILATRVLTAAPVSAKSDPQVEKLAERLAQLEAEQPRVGQMFARVGAQVGAAALKNAALDRMEEGTPEQQAAEAREASDHAQRENRHYDRLDQIAHAGGGVAPGVQLRKNVQTLRSLPAQGGRIELDVTALDCGDSLCRLEVRTGGAVNPASLTTRLMEGMGGNLSMRPGLRGRAVYYVAASGHQLPAMTP